MYISDVTNQRVAALEQECAALRGQVQELITSLQTTNARVSALEIQVHNRTFPNAGRMRDSFANRLTNRVAAIERAAMYIPVGEVVGVVNPDDDSEVEVEVEQESASEE